MAYPWDVRKNAIFQGVEASKAVMRDVAANRRSLALIGGGSGIGKTYHLRRIAKRHLIHHVPEDNPANAESLVSVTWQNRIWPVHSLNECDHLLRAERSINVLKLMHEEPRKCALFTKEAAMNEEHQRSGSRQYPRIDPADHVPARRSVPTRPDIQPRLYRPGGHVAVAERTLARTGETRPRSGLHRYVRRNAAVFVRRPPWQRREDAEGTPAYLLDGQPGDELLHRESEPAARHICRAVADDRRRHPR